jgi:hypothetical protein
MTETQVMYALIREMESMATRCPADVSTVTVKCVSNQLQVSTSHVGDSSEWRYAVVEVTNSDTAKYMRNIVAAWNGNVITTMLPWMNGMEPQAGDTIRVYGGPLKEVVVYKGEPSSLLEDVKDGKRFFVTIDSPAQDYAFKAMGGRAIPDLANTTKGYSFEMTLETPYTTGIPSEEEAIRADIDLPTLKDQTIAVLIKFMLQEKHRIMPDGDISTGFVTWERGGSQVLKVCVVEFDLLVV